MRILSGNTKWVDRTWEEIVVAPGNSSTQYFGIAGDNWNSQYVSAVSRFSFSTVLMTL